MTTLKYVRREFHSCCLFPINEGLCSFMLLLIVVKKSFPSKPRAHRDKTMGSFENKRTVWNHVSESGLAISKSSYWTKFAMGQRHWEEREHVYLCCHIIPKFVIRPPKETKTDFSVPILHYLCSLIEGSNFAVLRVISFECSSTILYTNFIVNVAREGGSGLQA